MGKLFNRPCVDITIERALNDYVSLGDEHERAIAQNFRADHRVTPSRQSAWLHDHPVAHASGFRNAVSGYGNRVASGPCAQTFFHPSNDSNIVLDLVRKHVRPNQELVTCLDLTKLHGLILDRSGPFGVRHFFYYPRTEMQDSKKVGSWHRDQIAAVGPRAHLTAILEAFRAVVTSGKIRNPVWVAKWNSVKPPTLTKDHPERWLARFGLQQFFVPHHWLAMLKYPASKAGTLVRPTALDAGLYSLHFASPPHAALADGGHPMNLRHLGGKVIAELIHEQIPDLIDINYWIDGWIGCTPDVPPALTTTELSYLRERQVKMLEKNYAGTTVWLTSVW